MGLLKHFCENPWGAPQMQKFPKHIFRLNWLHRLKMFDSGRGWNRSTKAPQKINFCTLVPGGYYMTK